MKVCNRRHISPRKVSYRSAKALRDLDLAMKRDKAIDISDFCKDHGIKASRSGDTFYFQIGGVKYRFSNHSKGYSNLCAYDSYGRKRRRLYHTKDDATVDIIGDSCDLPKVYKKLRERLSERLA